MCSQAGLGVCSCYGRHHDRPGVIPGLVWVASSVHDMPDRGLVLRVEADGKHITEIGRSPEPTRHAAVDVPLCSCGQRLEPGLIGEPHWPDHADGCPQGISGESPDVTWARAGRFLRAIGLLS